MSLKDDIYKLYWDDKLSQKEIGDIYGKSEDWVFYQMKKYKILTKKTTDSKTRFLRYVKIPNNPNDCWEWVGSKDKKGYGRFQFNSKQVQAHRVSYILFKREFDPTLCVLHKCDNPSCVNPKHLFLGTNKDNVMDMVQKGRNSWAKGEKQGNPKLIEKNVKEIKILLQQGKSTIEIGKLFGVNPSNISKIKRGYLWKHIK